MQSFLSKADMGVRMTGGNVAVMGDMVRDGHLVPVISAELCPASRVE